MDNKEFRIWAMGCSHLSTDLRYGRESLVETIGQAEQGGSDGGPPFEWDVALHLGDICGGQVPPGDAEGQEVVRQFAASTRHPREHFYNLLGNHDASGQDEPCQWWFKMWIDPTGEHTATSGVDAGRRPHPVEGTWERYAVRMGNVLLLMMGDRNDVGPPVGRGVRGGYPAGAVSGETFAWWRRMVEDNRDAIVISAHHHMLRETTVASGPWEGFTRNAAGEWQSGYHGYFPDGAPKGASYLYFCDGEPDAQRFEHYLGASEADAPAIDLWLGGHTHTHPDDRTGGRSHIETKWGVHFINVAALTRYHGKGHSYPMSRLLTFTEGSDVLKVQCYLHTSDYAPQGWYAPAERVLRLSKPFERKDRKDAKMPTGRKEKKPNA